MIPSSGCLWRPPDQPGLTRRMRRPYRTCYTTARDTTVALNNLGKLYEDTNRFAEAALRACSRSSRLASSPAPTSRERDKDA
jgi:hypothetical protein